MPNTVDQTFVTMATQSNLAEISAGTLALQRSPGLAGGEVGLWMTSDHQNAQAMLASIASSEGLTVPTTPDAAHQAVADALGQLNGLPFEQAYAVNQVVAHELTINLFQDEVQNGSDAALKSYASSMLPMLQAHLTGAVALQNALAITGTAV